MSFFKWAILGLFFVYFWSFTNKQYQFYNKLGNVINVHPVCGAGIRTQNFLIMSLLLWPLVQGSHPTIVKSYFVKLAPPVTREVMTSKPNWWSHLKCLFQRTKRPKKTTVGGGLNLTSLTYLLIHSKLKWTEWRT